MAFSNLAESSPKSCNVHTVPAETIQFGFITCMIIADHTFANFIPNSSTKIDLLVK